MGWMSRRRLKIALSTLSGKLIYTVFVKLPIETENMSAKDYADKYKWECITEEDETLLKWALEINLDHHMVTEYKKWKMKGIESLILK